MAENNIAVDLGGTNLRVALVKGKKIYKYIKEPTPKNKKDLLRLMVKLISRLMSKDVKGIGIGSPGPLEKGIIKNPPNIPLRDFNLKKYLEEKFNKKVEIENDAHCVALAEAEFGCKKKNFFILTLGTGIGGGVIIDGKIHIGRGMAGELGHIILDNGKSLEKLWKRKKNKIKELFKKKDKKSLEKISNYLAQGIGSLINVFDPEIVILTGGAREAGQPFLNMIKKYVKKYVIFPRVPDIKWSKLKHPGIIGAGLLVK